MSKTLHSIAGKYFLFFYFDSFVLLCDDTEILVKFMIICRMKHNFIDYKRNKNNFYLYSDYQI